MNDNINSRHRVLKVAIKVICRNQVLKRDVYQRGKGSLFHAHHVGHLSSSHHSRLALFSPTVFCKQCAWTRQRLRDNVPCPLFIHRGFYLPILPEQ